jgi:PAS domain S-box-containing protein
VPDETGGAIRKQLAGLGDPLTLLAGLFAHAPVGFQIYRADGHCLLVNDAFRAMFGAEPPPDYNVLADDIARARGVLPLIERAFAGETIHTPMVWYDARELSVKVSGGRRFAMTSTFFPLHDSDGGIAHIAVVFKDVTAEVERQELLEAIVEQSGDGIIVSDSDSVVRVFNPSAAEQHGVPKLEVAQEEWAASYGLHRLDGRPLPIDETPLHRALKGERVSDARWMVRRPDGSERILSGTATPLIHADGSRAGAMIVTRDETDRLRLEAELRQRGEERERVMGVLGHDLRNPLSAIAMAAARLMRRGLSPLQRELTTLVQGSVARMQRMISDLLDFSRVRAGGELPVTRRPDVELRAICEDVVAELRLAHPDRQIDADFAGEGRGAFDPDRIAQALSNLIGNAVEHGGRDSAIHVRLRQTADVVELSVHNHGEPIADAARARLFEPFRRGSETKEGGGGVGLGLFIVDHVVRAHGGRIAVTSTADAGTTFRLELPRR